MKSFIILLIAIVSFTGCNKKLKNYDMLSASLSNKFKNHIQLKEEEVKGIYDLNTRLFKNVIINVDNENKSMYQRDLEAEDPKDSLNDAILRAYLKSGIDVDEIFDPNEEDPEIADEQR